MLKLSGWKADVSGPMKCTVHRTKIARSLSSSVLKHGLHGLEM